MFRAWETQKVFDGISRNWNERRLLAAGLLRQGVPQAEVARQVGVHRQSVSRWAQQLAAGGRQALKKAGRAGRKPRLRTADLRRIERGLQRGPEALGYETSLWTAWRVAHLIEAGMWRALRSFAGLAHPAASWAGVASVPWAGRWSGTRPRSGSGRQKRWPEIKKKPKKKGEPSSSSTKAD